MNSRDRVIRAIEFGTPDRVPLWLLNKDQEKGDVLWYNFEITEGAHVAAYHGGELSEWGYTWQRMDDGTMGQPREVVIPSWDSLGSYVFPSLNPERRLARCASFLEASRDYYRLAVLIISGFNLYTFLRGFENSMIDFSEQSPQSAELLDGIFSFQKELLALAAKTGFQGFYIGDDWGTQDGLLISPEMWRTQFKPRYQNFFDYAHTLGLHVWMHSCGNVTAIVEDLHDAGVDVMNVSQPNVVQLEQVGTRLKGSQCFEVPISYQTVSIRGTPKEIMAEGRRLYDLLASDKGGFIGYVEEYGCMGMSEENFNACIKAFRQF